MLRAKVQISTQFALNDDIYRYRLFVILCSTWNNSVLNQLNLPDLLSGYPPHEL